MTFKPPFLKGKIPAKKKEKEIISYKGIIFDSKDELYFYWWCEEAYHNGLIRMFIYHPKPFILAEPLLSQRYTPGKRTEFRKLKKYTLTTRIKYTADFLIVFTEKAMKFKMAGLVFPDKKYGMEYLGNPSDYHFLAHVKNGFPYAIIDIKPAEKGLSNLASTRDFGIKRVWMMQQHNLYVNELQLLNGKKPEKAFFSQVFGPKKYIYRPMKKQIGFLKNKCWTVPVEEYLKNVG